MIFINARFLTQKVTGVQRYAIEICRRLPKEILGRRVVLVGPPSTINNPLFKEFDGICVGRSEGQLWEQTDLPLFLRRKKFPLLINFVGIGPVWYKNKVIFVYDLGFKHHPEWFSYIFQKTYNTFIPRSIQNSKLIIADSNYVKQDIRKTYKISPEKIEVVHAAPSDIFKKMDLAKKKEILMVSSIDPRKNIGRAVEAFGKINTDYKLIIVGGQGAAFSGVKLKELNNNVILTGYLNDEELVEQYNRAELFLYPSLFEGFGIPPLEAQICGTPCLISNSTSLPEVYGKSVEYCDPYDVNDIGHKMEFLLSSRKRREELIDLGFLNIKKYSWQDSAQKVALTITKLLNEKSIGT